MKKLIPLLMLSLVFWRCSSQNSKPADPNQTAESVEDNHALTPKVFDSFDDLSPFLNFKNDTTYIVNFWATWCKPCVEELPYFEKITAEYKDKPVKVILVSLDFKKQISKKLIPFMAQHNLQSEVMVLSDPDANSWISKIDTEWDGAIPTTLIYNRNSRKFISTAFENYDELETILRTFL